MSAEPQPSQPRNATRAAFSLTEKLTQPELAEVVNRVWSGATARGPLVVDLDPTTACDLACPECISHDVLHSQRFDNARLYELAAECVELEVRGVVLIGGGEPLLHSGTRRAVEILAAGGVHVGLVTNATLLHKYHDALRDTLRWLRVSLDAGSSETFRRVRPARSEGRDVFRAVMRNLEVAAHSYRARVGASFVLFSGRDAADGRSPNIGDVSRAARLVKGAGAAYLELKPELDAGHRIVELTSRDQALLESQADELSSLEDDSFQIVRSSGMRSLAGVAFDRFEPKEYAECPIAELRTLITPHGAYVCTYHRGRDAARLGDPTTTSLREIWSQNRRSLVNPSIQCRFHCAHHEQNLMLTGPHPPGVAAQSETRRDDDFDPFV